MKTPLVAAICAIAVVAAFVAGRATSGAEAPAEAPSHSDDSARLAREVEDLTRKLEEERTRRPRGEGGRARSREEAPQETAAPVDAAPAAAPAADAAPGGEPPAFSLEGVTEPAEASKRFMAFAEAQLARGDAGYAAILQALDGLFKEKEKMQMLFSDETAAARELYPWIKFLVTHEAQVTDLNEYVFRTMAEKPSAFASTSSSKSLEMFTEGLSFVMPGAVPEERLARLRGYAEKIIATPESQQPEAIRGNRSEIERLLARFWAAPITAEQALEKLKSGDVPARDLVRYLRMVPPDAAAMIDVTALVLPHVKQGSYEVLRGLGYPPLDHLDFARLDQAVLEGIDANKTNWPQFATYVQRSGRKQWTDVRPLFDRALAQGERTSAAALQVLVSGMLQANLRPDRAYVESLLTRSDVSEAMQTQLKAMYGIGKQ
jgi:hypothetical protein